MFALFALTGGSASWDEQMIQGKKFRLYRDKQ